MNTERKKHIPFFLVVSNDEYEHILDYSVSVGALARRLGVSRQAIYHSLRKGYTIHKDCRIRIICVPPSFIGDDEEIY